MSRFKPQLTYMTRESLENYYNTPSYVKGVSKYITIQYKTYAELLRNLKEHLKVNIDDDGVNVLRSRRGQWGEWYEHWKLDNNENPTIIKEGWN
tara:strand:+ start:17588 stop:17869 length:282 start_codon:yes stop_codon:yes gene_type:complete